jgi:hypothetical protein
MKKRITYLLLLVSLIITAQSSRKDFVGSWQSQDDITNYFVFSKEQSIRVSISAKYGITDLYFTYGFCDELKLKSINDLKDEGYYYFEVEPSNFQEKYKNKDGTYRGIQANIIQMEEDKNSFQIYDPMRPGQRGTYKRVNKLPEKLDSILKSKGIVIPITNKNEKLKIKISKSRIYTKPNVASKMFLVQGDEVSVLEEKSGWLHILYMTAKNKEIKGWIKKEDMAVE